MWNPNELLEEKIQKVFSQSINATMVFAKFREKRMKRYAFIDE